MKIKKVVILFKDTIVFLIKIVLSALNPLIGLIVGFLMAVSDLFIYFIQKLFTKPYDKFEEKLDENLWSISKPTYTPKKDIEFRVDIKDGFLNMIIRKRYSPEIAKLPEPRKWEGYEITAKKKGFNFIQAKIMLDFNQSTSPDGNIYICGRGKEKRFHYLLGIDKRSKEIFFHCWDEKRGHYIEEGGRVHLKDYFEKRGFGWMTLALEWTYNGVYYLVFDEKEEEFNRYPFYPPPENYELRKEILKDSRDIFFYGIEEFCIRTDLKVDSPDFKSIVGKVKFIKVRKAPLSFLR
jgi:hypothetical protein